MTWLILKIVGFILFYHWIADFIVQTDEEAKGKSTDNVMLLSHTSTYAAMWVIPGLILSLFYHIPPILVLEFIAITFVAHTITDYITSRLNKYLWEKGDVHNFFVSIGFDQLLHYAQLLITFKLLFT